MIKKWWLASILLLMLLNSTSPIFAHEFWLEPEKFILNEHDTLMVDIKNGQNFKGDAIAYLPFNQVSFSLSVGGKSLPINSRLGDMPAINQVVDQSGLYSIQYASKGHSVSYDEQGKFKDFLNDVGLSDIWPSHLARGLPETGFKEIYYRFAKTLVQVGATKGQDRVSGMLFEWQVIDSNNADTNSLVLRLWYKNKPLANAPVTIFYRTQDTVELKKYHTDEQGELIVTAEQPATLLINSVKIRPLPVTWPTEKAVWESLWASLVIKL